MTEWDPTNAKTDMAANLTDKRTDKEGYMGKDVKMSLLSETVNGGAYSVGTGGTLTASDLTIPAYCPSQYNVVSPVFAFDNAANNITKTSEAEPFCTYTNGLISVGTKDKTKVLDFSSVAVTKDGEAMDVRVSVDNANAAVNGRQITFDTSVTDYTVTFSTVLDTAGYYADGSRKSGSTAFSWDINVHIALLVWDLEKGAYSASPVVFNDAEKEKNYKVITLTFSDGTKVGVVSEHGFFDTTLGKYVHLDKNAADYIGHSFIKAKGSGWTTVKLTDVAIQNQVTSVYSPVTYSSLCLYTNDMLSMPGGVSGLFNICKVDMKTMRYDAKAKKSDIAKYGLFTLDDFGGKIPAEAFDAFNGADLKVAIGKGILSLHDIEKYAAAAAQ